MKCKIEFQYKSPKSSRPQEEPQDEPIELREGEFVPIPNVGDSVGFLYGGKKTGLQSCQPTFYLQEKFLLHTRSRDGYFQRGNARTIEGVSCFGLKTGPRAINDQSSREPLKAQEHLSRLMLAIRRCCAESRLR